LTVSYRDVQYILPVVTQFLLYGSPVAYAVSEVPTRYWPYYFLNPLSALLEAFRWSLLGGAGGALRWGYLGFSASICVLTFIVGMFTFKKMERQFADVV